MYKKVVYGDRPADITAMSVMIEKEGLAFNILDLNEQTPHNVSEHLSLGNTSMRSTQSMIMQQPEKLLNEI